MVASQYCDNSRQASLRRLSQKRLWWLTLYAASPMFERPRGTNDWGSQDMAKRRFVESRFVQLAESFGFREVSTPTFESLELFTAKSGPAIVRELYAFKDQGGRDLALRPEFTASILRFYVADLRSRPKPLKLYSTGNVFRYEEPQKGRYREVSQGNAEVIGGAPLRAGGGAGSAGFEYLQKIADLLDAYGVSRKDYAFDMGVVRGLDYYTGMVFEIDSPNLGAEKQVGGGGAYDLAEVFGGERIAQTGFALGLDRLVMSRHAEKTIEPPRPLDAYVVPIGEGAQRKAIEVLTSLRAGGLGADMDLVGRGPSKNLDYANAIGARYAVLLGEKELKAARATVRDMASGVQREVALADLADAILSPPVTRGPESAKPKRRASGTRAARPRRP